jgi:hypothetical protein
MIIALLTRQAPSWGNARQLPRHFSGTEREGEGNPA